MPETYALDARKREVENGPDRSNPRERDNWACKYRIKAWEAV